MTPRALLPAGLRDVLPPAAAFEAAVEAAMNDPSFLCHLDAGRAPGLATADRLLAFMGLAPMGPAFRREVAAALVIGEEVKPPPVVAA